MKSAACRSSAFRVARLLGTVVAVAMLAACGEADRQPADEAGADQSTAAGATQFAVAGVDYDDVDQFLTRLQDAFMRDDAAGVAELVSFPLQVNQEQGAVLIAVRQDLLMRFGEVFPDSVRQVVLGAQTPTLFANWKGIMLGNGEVWIGGVCGDTASTVCPVRIIAVNLPTLRGATE